MLTKLATALGMLGLLVAGPRTVAAQDTPTDADLTLRPGDTITWSPDTPHRLRFGGTVQHATGEVEVTSFADVKKVLEVSLQPSTSGAVSRWPAGTEVVAKVTKDAEKKGVDQFRFTCGVPEHAGDMVSVLFKIVASDGSPGRNVRIVSAPNPRRWLLKTTQGDKDLRLRKP